MSWWQFHFTIINRNYVVQLYATSKSDSYPHSLIIFFNSKFILKCIYVALSSVHNACLLQNKICLRKIEKNEVIFDFICTSKHFSIARVYIHHYIRSVPRKYIGGNKKNQNKIK